MTLQDGQQLGKKVLAKVDLLVEVISALVINNPEEQEDYFAQGCVLVNELKSLLEEMIGPKEEYIKEAIKELITQRLPEQNILTSYDVDLFELLNSMYIKNESVSNKTAKSVKEHDDEPLRKAINYLFPQYKIIKNYRQLGCSFSYYIPSLKLAIDNNTDEKSSDFVRKECISRQIGINFLSIPVKELCCSREIVREIKRCLDMNKLFMLE